MKKILFFLPTLNGGGAERVTVNIIRQLDKNQFNIKLILIHKTGKLLELIPPDVEIIDLKLKKTIFSILKLRQIIKKENPDIIYSSLFRMHIALDLALTARNNKPKIILRSPNSPKLLLKNQELNFLTKILLEKAYHNADKIIAQTPEMKKEIIKYHHIKETKITVFLNPIDSQLIDKSISKTSNPFNKRDINILASGRLTKQKGFDTLIKSFELIIKKNNHFKLYIIGEDHGMREELEKLITSLHLEEHIFLLGFQTNPYRYLYYSDAYVLSSRWEGLPNTVLESLYLKKPVIATKCIPFMNTLIQDKKNGILVDVDDIPSLANAILNYREIDVHFKTIDFSQTTLENLFT